MAPTYNVARGEFVIRETKREIRPTRKLSGFFVFWGQKKLAVNSSKLKVKEIKKGKGFNAEGTEVGAQRARRRGDAVGIEEPAGCRRYQC